MLETKAQVRRFVVTAQQDVMGDALDLAPESSARRYEFEVSKTYNVH